jgi:hypothetical protein
MRWPDGKRAAFAIVDDTDDATLPDIANVYSHLLDAGLRITKTVWVYPVRDTQFFRGDSLMGNDSYLAFIRQLAARGFEIGLHNVGSGDFSRREIEAGLEYFRSALGAYPRLHVNHSYNKDNIYGGEKRFSFPFDLLVRLMHRQYRGFEGEIRSSLHFWGDLHKKHIRYSRSYEIDDFNLLRAVSFPYTDARYDEFCNAFYPSVFCSNQDLFARQVTEDNVKRLIDEQGCSIIYTHLGYFCERGGVDKRFVAAVLMLKRHERDLWIAPVGEVLDYMSRVGGQREIGRLAKLRVEAKSLWTRLKYRHVVKLDDYHYKKAIGSVHRAAGHGDM